MDEVMIYAYSRKQAIEDGVLVDLTPLAWKVGFCVPVAVTSAVWVKCIEGPPAMSGEDQVGRSRDILRRLRDVTAHCGDQREAFFSLLVQKDTEKMAMETLKANISPGDEGEPVITIMFTDED